MKQTHSSLKFSTNIILILVWGAAVALLLSVLETLPIVILTAGSAFGFIGGLMQLFSFKESTQSFKSASTMLEVRKALKNTKWGRRYLYFLWISNITLVLISFLATNNPLINILVGYFLLMFVREIVTLKPTLEFNSDNVA